MKFGVVVFPGSNCDHDAYYACKHVLGEESVFLWHKDSDLQDVDAVILPGGFSFGDYLRCGAIARFSPIMKEVVAFANKGGTVLGICNGFQVLQEAGLLPGVLLRNTSLTFVCRYLHIRVESVNTRFTSECVKGEVLEIPVAHGEGNFFADESTLKRLEDEDRIVFKYCDPKGEVTAESNPNGSLGNIAGIVNEDRNVLGMMPHPERAVDPVLRHTDGRKILRSIIEFTISRLADQALLSAGAGGR